jgi:hypothetical protein
MPSQTAWASDEDKLHLRSRDGGPSSPHQGACFGGRPGCSGSLRASGGVAGRCARRPSMVHRRQSRGRSTLSQELGSRVLGCDFGACPAQTRETGETHSVDSFAPHQCCLGSAQRAPSVPTMGGIRGPLARAGSRAKCSRLNAAKLNRYIGWTEPKDSVLPPSAPWESDCLLSVRSADRARDTRSCAFRVQLRSARIARRSGRSGARGPAPS